MLKNKTSKTTIAGVLTILASILSGIATYLTTGHWPDFGVTIGAITAGLGLIAAQDNGVKK